MTIDDYAAGKEAARLFGVSRPDEVWRAIRRHGETYPGRIEVERIGGVNAVNRADLAAFAKWYRATISKPTRPDKRAERKAALKAAINRLHPGTSR